MVPISGGTNEDCCFDLTSWNQGFTTGDLAALQADLLSGSKDPNDPIPFCPTYQCHGNCSPEIVALYGGFLAPDPA